MSLYDKSAVWLTLAPNPTNIVGEGAVRLGCFAGTGHMGMSTTTPGERTGDAFQQAPLGRKQSGGRSVRRVVIRDGLVFFVLCCVTVVLFGITLSLFRSFQQHREDLAKRWSSRGRIALAQGRPADAVTALRTALSYEPDVEADQLALAQALANAGHTEEANNYFLNLWVARPGDGFINLQLARLAAKQGNASEAVEHYRASIFGNWQGDGVMRRRDVRLELANYLASRGDLSGAKVELLIAAGNAPRNPVLDTALGDRLVQIGALPDALTIFQQVLHDDPHARPVLERAGRTAYALRDYSTASRYLSEALAETPKHLADNAETVQTRSLAANAARILSLNASRDLPATERADHLFVDAQIARLRLATCSGQQPVSGPNTPTNSIGPTGVAPALQGLEARWTAVGKSVNRKALARDASMDDTVADLISDTERQTALVCGPSTGDDALLLLLSSATQGTAQ